MTMLPFILEGVKAEEIYEKTGEFPDPNSTDNAKFKILLSIIRVFASHHSILSKPTWMMSSKGDEAGKKSSEGSFDNHSKLSRDVETISEALYKDKISIRNLTSLTIPRSKSTEKFLEIGGICYGKVTLL
ncbi:hypothetical protein RIF29_29016 [Crotalaria pallida]|uniref:Uncharacterized protein n=1 Tax=Crotalaria pallida TaxID=3830 RepID=A0AAN9EKH1_CROPI